jgi:hypothetical protein
MTNLHPKEIAAIEWKSNEAVERWRQERADLGLGPLSPEQTEQALQTERAQLLTSGNLTELVAEHDEYLRDKFRQRASGRGTSL